MSQLPFWLSDAGVLAVQAGTVALPGRLRSLPRGVPRGAGWALLPAGSIVAVVVAINATDVTADALAWLALIGVPVLAALALGGLARGARPALAPLAAVLLAVAWADRASLPGEAAATLLSALSCVALGAILATLAPSRWLKVGIVAMAVVDTWFVSAQLLQAPNSVLDAAVPAAGLPQLQRIHLGSALMGYGDPFVAGVLGGVLAAEARGDQGRIALLTLAIAGAFDLLFFVVDLLPATVPVALALLVREGMLRRGRTRAQPARAGPSGAVT